MIYPLGPGISLSSESFSTPEFSPELSTSTTVLIISVSGCPDKISCYPKFNMTSLIFAGTLYCYNCYTPPVEWKEHQRLL